MTIAQNQIVARLLRICLLTFRCALIVKYFRKDIPKHQILTFFVLEKFIRFCNKNNIRVFIHDGTLLGAVRDKKFAGRPSDLDFIAHYEDLIRLRSLIKIEPPRFLRIMRRTKFLSDIVVVHWGKMKGHRIYIPVHIFGEELTTIELNFAKTVVYESRPCLEVKSTLKSIEFHYFDLDDFIYFEKVYIFGLEVNVPRNPIKYVEFLYGRHWRIPTAVKQDFVER